MQPSLTCVTFFGRQQPNSWLSLLLFQILSPFFLRLDLRVILVLLAYWAIANAFFFPMDTPGAEAGSA
jgi:hypothetical protein